MPDLYPQKDKEVEQKQDGYAGWGRDWDGE